MTIAFSFRQVREPNNDLFFCDTRSLTFAMIDSQSMVQFKFPRNFLRQQRTVRLIETASLSSFRSQVSSSSPTELVPKQ